MQLTDPLSIALERFNRKERNILVRDMLGHAEEPLRLAPRFLGTLGEAVPDLAVPADAWWATDYHFDWIAGALRLFAAGGTVPDGPAGRWANSGEKGERLVAGNQQDVDLLIAWGGTLLLIEAKAYGKQDNTQLMKKAYRLRQLDRLAADLALPALRFRFLLAAIDKPGPPPAAPWPSWACPGGRFLWVALRDAAWLPDGAAAVLKVTRCGPPGGRASDEHGTHWRILREGRSKC
ncbi:hypothetical protein [Falsiroseomonas sp. CW058]|uniref:hypothetical protein n=1 Tax=Falsiroseomonas sp. CW058 TaxID=3388664 RepID=UPI003D32198B